MRIRELVYEPFLQQAAHVHDSTSVSFVARGELEETACGERRSGTAGDVIVKPAGVVHEDLFGPSGATMYTLVLDGDAGRYQWMFGGAPAALFVRAIREWRAGAAFEEIAIDLLAAVPAGGSRVRGPRMSAVADRVAGSDVAVDALAREMSMHPVALARAFRRELGMSITCFRRRTRVRKAASLLASTSLPLAEVALESGFSDQSHLCRIFKSELGTTPAAFRALAV
jgi:AraC family transcriptional regulator